MLSEQQAIAAATEAFREKMPEAAVKEISAFTPDNGLTWMVHFTRPTRVEVDEETGNITWTCESNNSWCLCVCGETGRTNWVETL